MAACLRRTAGRRGVSEHDVERHALERALATPSPEADWFEPQFLRRHPLRIVQQAVRQFLDADGPFVRVERDGERWRAVYEHGEEPVIARFGGDGRIAGLGIGPVATAAVVELPYREWPRAVVRRRMATAMILPCVVPPILAVVLWTDGGVIDWALVAAFGVLVLPAIWVSTPWHLLTRALRAPLVGGSALAAAASAERLPGLAMGGLSWWPVIALVALVVGASLRLRDRPPSAASPPVELELPLGRGTYVVAQGGPVLLNGHATNVAQRRALDILALGPLWARCTPPALYPGRLDRYVIFGRPVVAPCAGTVVEVADDIPDLEPPLRTPDRPPGNYVAIDAGGTTVLLAHLRLGTVLVAEGDRVVAGQPLGRVGNSGNSSEPHLHIHAERDGVGVPMVFRGAKRRPLRRNDLIRIPD